MPDDDLFDDLAHFDEKRSAHDPADLEAEEAPAEEGALSEFGYLTDELDHAILMHRDAHFGGDFSRMLEYYALDLVGVNPDFDEERIRYLQSIEEEMGQNLAPLMLSGPEAEKVGRAQRAYASLKEIYDVEEEKSPIPRLLADLILSEEEEPRAEIEAIVEQGENIVPELVALIQKEDLYDPLFPGYGQAPAFLICCLGALGDARAIVPLFECLGREVLFEEEAIFHAIFSIGNEAKAFLIKVLTSRPLSPDNEKAAAALSFFAEEEEVALLCLEELKKPEVQKSPLLASYLVCNLASLAEKKLHPLLQEYIDDKSHDPRVIKKIQELLAD